MRNYTKFRIEEKVYSDGRREFLPQGFDSDKMEKLNEINKKNKDDYFKEEDVWYNLKPGSFYGLFASYPTKEEAEQLIENWKKTMEEPKVVIHEY